jgi:hypothetical protein
VIEVNQPKTLASGNLFSGIGRRRGYRAGLLNSPGIFVFSVKNQCEREASEPEASATGRWKSRKSVKQREASEPEAPATGRLKPVARASGSDIDHRSDG